MKRAVVPGTFDPITKGHIDVIERTAQIFDEVVVAVAASAKKNPLFSHEERIALAQASVKDLANVSACGFSGLLTDFVSQCQATAVVKGLRAITDFEYEFQMTAINYLLDANVETLFVMSAPEYMYLSSSVVREIAACQGAVEQFVPGCVAQALYSKFEYPQQF